MQDYFPTKIAQGAQFCNCVKEKQLLNDCIAQGRHCVLVAPRRYGKSSLVLKVTNEVKTPLAAIDLFLAHDDLAVTKRMLSGISAAISQLLPVEQKVLSKLQACFAHLRVSLNAAGFSLEAGLNGSTFDPVDQIFTALQGLDKLAKQQKQTVIFFIDEFQDIREANNAKTIQGAIRHIAQETTNIVFIFSGSNRHLLLEMFDDSSKPLYMLCDIFHLERMTSADYLPHLQKLAKKQWQTPLPELVFNKIMSLTELHPYYVNLLCHELWKQTTLPSFDDVLSAWQHCFESQHERLIAELEKLTSKQQTILKALALEATTEPSGLSFVSKTKISTSTIMQAIKILRNKDMIYQVKQLDERLPQWQLKQLRVLDPLLAYALRQYA